MGIPGLLPALKSITKTVHVNAYGGQRVAVDAYCWLHRGAYSCSQELCEGEATSKCVKYCMERVELLQASGVTPVIVFDGGRLPMKGEEEAARRRAREQNLERARAHRAAGNLAAANDSYQKAVDISPKMAKQFIEALKISGVDFIVAPYEADAQMAYLALRGHVQTVITEDSDLLAYGCPTVLYKMDRGGVGQQICRSDLSNNKDLTFTGFTDDMFLEMCIFVGCDFLKALPGIGIKKAHGHMRKLKSYSRVVKSLRFSGTSVPRNYEEAFQRALWTFRHQRVFCPEKQVIVHLHDLPEGGLRLGGESLGDALEFLGPPLPDHLARGVATGNIDPITHQPFDTGSLKVLQPLNLNTEPSTGISRGALKSQAKQRRSDQHAAFSVQANGIQNYFTKIPAPGQAGCSASPRSGRLQKEDLDPEDNGQQANRHRLGLCKGPHKPAVGILRRSLSASASLPEGGTDDESPAERASKHVDSTGSQPETSRPARTSGGSIFSRFRMCPVAQSAGGASACSTPETSQDSLGPSLLPNPALARPASVAQEQGPSAPAGGPVLPHNMPQCPLGTVMQGPQRLAGGSSPDHAAEPSSSVALRTETSDLVNFAESPPSAAQRLVLLAHQGPDLRLPFAEGMESIPDTPADNPLPSSGAHAYAQPLYAQLLPSRCPRSSFAGLEDDQQAERAHLDRLFGNESCSMELASCQLTSHLQATERRDENTINALFASPPASHSHATTYAQRAAARMHAAASPELPSLAEQALSGGKGISPLPCPSPEFEPLSRPARRGLVLPKLNTRCSTSPRALTPEDGALAHLLRPRSPGFAPLREGLRGLSPGAPLQLREDVPSTIELLAREEEGTCWGAGGGQVDVGPLEGGTLVMRTLEPAGVALASWHPPRPVSSRDLSVSPGPLQEGLEPSAVDLRPGGPLQQAVEASCLRQGRIGYREQPAVSVSSDDNLGDLLLVGPTGSAFADTSHAPRERQGGGYEGLAVAIPAPGADGGPLTLGERTGSGKRKTTGLALDSNSCKRPALGCVHSPNRPLPPPGNSPRRSSAHLDASLSSWPQAEAELAGFLGASPMSTHGGRHISTHEALPACPEEDNSGAWGSSGAVSRDKEVAAETHRGQSNGGAEQDAVHVSRKEGKTRSSFFSQRSPRQPLAQGSGNEQWTEEQEEGGFHSVSHIARFEKVAEATLDRLQAMAKHRTHRLAGGCGGEDASVVPGIRDDASTKRLRQAFCPPRPQGHEAGEEASGGKWLKAAKSLQKPSVRARTALAKPFSNFSFGAKSKKQ